jgi:hypothetical protein
MAMIMPSITQYLHNQANPQQHTGHNELRHGNRMNPKMIRFKENLTISKARIVNIQPAKSLYKTPDCFLASVFAAFIPFNKKTIPPTQVSSNSRMSELDSLMGVAKFSQGSLEPVSA